MRVIILLLVFAGVAMSVEAVQRIVVRGLFDGKAVVSIDGRQRLLTVGRRSPEGVLLISADSDKAVIEIDGRRRVYRLGNEAGGYFRAPVPVSLHIAADDRGMYRTSGTINGQVVDFLVDTGATVIAMNAAQARRLGIDYRRIGRRGRVITAAGPVMAWNITLRQVTVGRLKLDNVRAVVLSGSNPRTTLLGMSFLGRVRMQHQGRILMLSQDR